jgi:hypothetical protein
MKKGAVIIPSDARNIWPHELRTAQALADVGYSVTFLPESTIDGVKTPDVEIDGKKFEMKSPRTDKTTQVEKNLKKASAQSPNIIIDSQRVKRIQDNVLQKYLANRYEENKSIKNLLFVNRRREVVDIAGLVLYNGNVKRRGRGSMLSPRDVSLSGGKRAK